VFPVRYEMNSYILVLHNEEVHNYIIRTIRSSWRIRRMEHVANVGEIINAYKMLIGNM
jgi:hypothetical protein